MHRVILGNVLFHNLVMGLKYFVLAFYSIFYIFNIVNLKKMAVRDDKYIKQVKNKLF